MNTKYTDWVCPLERMKGINGIRLTEGLFYESQQSKGKLDNPVYTLQDKNRGEVPSAYLIYMSSVDEYEAAVKLVGSLGHWRKLCGLSWFMEGRPDVGFEGLHQWREDMEARDKSTSKAQLLSQAEQGNVAAIKAINVMSRKTFSNKQAREKAKRTHTSSAVVSLIQRMENNN